MSNQDRRIKKTERLFGLVLLLQTRPNMTSRDLAAHFGVSRRTIFRDLQTLTETGVPLTYGDEGGYQILEGYQLPPLMITAKEAATLLVGLGFMKLQSDPALSAEADAVEMKIKEVLPSETRSFIQDLQDRTLLDPYWASARRKDQDRDGWWHKITEAVARQHSILIDYYVQSRDEVTKRSVDPLGLVYYTDHWNLIGFDHLRNTIRNFRLDRIRELRVSMERFTIPDDFELADYVDQSKTSDEVHEVSIRFSNTVAQTALDTIPARIDTTSSNGDATVVTFYFNSLEFLAGWLRRFGSDALVLDPDELKDLVAREGRRVMDLYQ